METTGSASAFARIRLRSSASVLESIGPDGAAPGENERERDWRIARHTYAHGTLRPSRPTRTDLLGQLVVGYTGYLWGAAPRSCAALSGTRRRFPGPRARSENRADKPVPMTAGVH